MHSSSVGLAGWRETRSAASSHLATAVLTSRSLTLSFSHLEGSRERVGARFEELCGIVTLC
jgi:hypothetical protein